MVTDYKTYTELPPFENAIWGGPGEPIAKNAPGVIKWGGKKAPPKIGEKVEVNLHKFKGGVVTGYFTEMGWLGCLVQFNKRPDWHIRQRGRGKVDVHCFGIDFDVKEKV